MSPDGSTLAFSFQGDIWTVPVDGGRATRLTIHEAYESYPRWSPDGRFIAFVFRTNGEFRKGYVGPANKDIWIYDTQSNRYTRFTNFDGNDFRPEWVGSRTVLFVSERNGTYNVYRRSIDDNGDASGTAEQVTSFSGDGVRTFGVSADGGTLVLERQTDLYIMRGGGSARLLQIPYLSAAGT